MATGCLSQLKSGLASAPNRVSISDSPTSSGQWSPLIARECDALFRLGQRRQREVKGCTWASVSDNPDAAAMGLDNRTSQSQAHPGALGFRRKERPEYAFKVFHWQPYTSVA